MKLKCNYCGSFIKDTDEKCPNCGAVNEHLMRSADGIPKTIEELKAFCQKHNLPLKQMRFFIGENFTEPKAFGIYKDDEGNFLWPGFGDNLRVLDWIIDRCEGKVDAVETPIGFVPKAEDINLEGIEDEVSKDQLKEILSVDTALWRDEVAGIEEFYSKFDRLPATLKAELETLKANVNK